MNNEVTSELTSMSVLCIIMELNLLRKCFEFLMNESELAAAGLSSLVRQCAKESVDEL